MPYNTTLRHYKFTRGGKTVARNPRRPLTVEKATQTNQSPAVSLSCERTFPRNCGPPVFGARSFLRGPQALAWWVSVSRHAEGGDIYASFLLRSSPRPEWKQYVTGGIRGLETGCTKFLQAARPPPNVNTNASAVTAPTPPPLPPHALHVMILNEQSPFHPVARHRLG